MRLTLHATAAREVDRSVLRESFAGNWCSRSQIDAEEEQIRRSGRVAEGAPLLREYTLIAYRGFESLLLRHLIKSASLWRRFLLGADKKR